MPALIVAAWVALTLALIDGARPAREAALAALTAVWVAMLAFTQLLSVFGALSFVWLALCWAVMLATLLVVFRARILSGLAAGREAASGGNWSALDLAVAATLLFLGAGTLLSALLYPIVNYDTCHAVRVFFWFQNGSIAPVSDTGSAPSSSRVHSGRI